MGTHFDLMKTSPQVAEVTLIDGGPYSAENFVDAVRRLGDVAKAHDMLHPDRDVCGGVGHCELLASEYDLERNVVARLRLGIGVSYSREDIR